MSLRACWQFYGCLIVLCGCMLSGGIAVAAPPWANLLPFRRVEADANKTYELTEAEGPWMILVSSFAGPTAEAQANDLVLELRSRFKMPAYIHRRKFDYSEPVVGLGLNRYGAPKKMRHRHASKFTEYAVLVGDYADVSDPNLDRTLNKIKFARPECLEFSKEKATAQRMVLFRQIQRRLNMDESKRAKGPMGSAFVTRNPMLPAEMFQKDPLDDLVIKINEDVEYGLLKNPGRYTVRVATFRGHVTMDLKEIKQMQSSRQHSGKLAEAADKAHRLTVALRKKGVEAYEFHDRHESIVTIGSFDSVGTPDTNGKIQINPAIHQVMKTYGAEARSLPGTTSAGMVQKRLAGVSFDVQAMPVMVPKKSFTTAMRR